MSDADTALAKQLGEQAMAPGVEECGRLRVMDYKLGQRSAVNVGDNVHIDKICWQSQCRNDAVG